MACSIRGLKLSLSHRISTFLPGNINQIRIQTSLAWDYSIERPGGQTRCLSRIYFIDGAKEVIPQMPKSVITYQAPPIALQVRNVSFSCITPKPKDIDSECNAHECNVLYAYSSNVTERSVFAQDIQAVEANADLMRLTPGDPHRLFNAVTPLDSLDLYFQLHNHPNLSVHIEEDVVGREKAPVTVLSGYLDAAPYLVYCTGDEKGILSKNTKNVLSEVERQSLLYSSSDRPEKVLERTGKPTAEQVQVVFNKLSESLRSFFTRPHDYSIYHKDVIFENNIRRVTTHGLSSYVQQLSLVRVLGHLKYAHVKMEILKITQHPEDGTIRVRWRILGVSGIRALFFFWKFRLWEWKKMMQNETEWVDGFSIFYVGSEGLVYKHICDKVMPDEEHVKSKPSAMAVKLALFLGLVPESSGLGLDAMAIEHNSVNDGLSLPWEDP